GRDLRGRGSARALRRRNGLAPVRDSRGDRDDRGGRWVGGASGPASEAGLRFQPSGPAPRVIPPARLGGSVPRPPVLGAATGSIPWRGSRPPRRPTSTCPR